MSIPDGCRLGKEQGPWLSPKNVQVNLKSKLTKYEASYFAHFFAASFSLSDFLSDDGNTISAATPTVFAVTLTAVAATDTAASATVNTAQPASDDAIAALRPIAAVDLITTEKSCLIIFRPFSAFSVWLMLSCHRAIRFA
jgi:hypothetical protein